MSNHCFIADYAIDGRKKQVYTKLIIKVGPAAYKLLPLCLYRAATKLMGGAWMYYLLHRKYILQLNALLYLDIQQCTFYNASTKSW